jgi:hypothetical protein
MGVNERTAAAARVRSTCQGQFVLFGCLAYVGTQRGPSRGGDFPSRSGATADLHHRSCRGKLAVAAGSPSVTITAETLAAVSTPTAGFARTALMADYYSLLAQAVGKLRASPLYRANDGRLASSATSRTSALPISSRILASARGSFAKQSIVLIRVMRCRSLVCSSSIFSGYMD